MKFQLCLRIRHGTTNFKSQDINLSQVPVELFI